MRNMKTNQSNKEQPRSSHSRPRAKAGQRQVGSYHFLGSRLFYTRPLGNSIPWWNTQIWSRFHLCQRSQQNSTFNPLGVVQSKWDQIQGVPSTPGTNSPLLYMALLMRYRLSQKNGPSQRVSSREGTPPRPEECSFHNERRDSSSLPNVRLGILILITQLQQNHTKNYSWDLG